MLIDYRVLVISANVLANHQVLGMLSRDSVIGFLRTARELGA